MAIRGIGVEFRDYQGEDELDLFLSALTRNTDENKAVMGSAEDTVALVTTNLNFCGVVREIDPKNKNAAVQMDGNAVLTYDGADPSPPYGYMYLVGGATAGKVKVATEGDLKEVTVTVSTGQTSGASAADPTLVGGTVEGVAPTGNEDQLVDNIVVGADGAVTVTLAAAATGNNTFSVTIKKAVGMRPIRRYVYNTDTTGKRIAVKL